MASCEDDRAFILRAIKNDVMGHTSVSAMPLFLFTFSSVSKQFSTCFGLLHLPPVSSESEIYIVPLSLCQHASSTNVLISETRAAVISLTPNQIIITLTLFESSLL